MFLTGERGGLWIDSRWIGIFDIDYLTRKEDLGILVGFLH